MGRCKDQCPFHYYPVQEYLGGFRRSLAGMEDLTTGLFLIVMSMFGLGETLEHTGQAQVGDLMV